MVTGEGRGGGWDSGVGRMVGVSSVVTDHRVTDYSSRFRFKLFFSFRSLRWQPGPDTDTLRPCVFFSPVFFFPHLLCRGDHVREPLDRYRTVQIGQVPSRSITIPCTNGLDTSDRLRIRRPRVNPPPSQRSPPPPPPISPSPSTSSSSSTPLPISLAITLPLSLQGSSPPPCESSLGTSRRRFDPPEDDRHLLPFPSLSPSPSPSPSPPLPISLALALPPPL